MCFLREQARSQTVNHRGHRYPPPVRALYSALVYNAKRLEDLNLGRAGLAEAGTEVSQDELSASIRLATDLVEKFYDPAYDFPCPWDERQSCSVAHYLSTFALTHLFSRVIDARTARPLPSK